MNLIDDPVKTPREWRENLDTSPKYRVLERKVPQIPRLIEIVQRSRRLPLLLFGFPGIGRFSSPSLSIAEESGLGGGHLDRSALVTAIVFGGLIKWSVQVLQLHRQGECPPVTTITETWNRAGAVKQDSS